MVLKSENVRGHLMIFTNPQPLLSKIYRANSISVKIGCKSFLFLMITVV